jgi:ATP-binding cassette, subfamily B, bacterial
VLNREIFVRCLRLLYPVRWHVVALLVMFAVWSLVLLLPTLMFFDIFWTRVMQGQPLTEAGAHFLGLDPTTVADPVLFTPELRKSIARRAIAVAIGVMLVSTPIFLTLWYYQVWILQRTNHLLRLALVDRLQTLSLRFHADSRVGDAIYRVYQDSAMVTQLIEVMILTPLMTGGRFVFSLGVVALFDPSLSLVLLLAWPPALALGWWFSSRLRTAFRLAREANSRLTSHIQEVLMGLKVIKAYGAERREQARFEEESLRAFDAAFRARNLFAVLLMLVFWVVAAALLAAYFQATLATRAEAELFAKRALAAATLTAWNVGLYGFFKERFGDGTIAIRVLLRVWARAQDIGVGLQRVFEVLDMEPEVRDAPDARAMTPPRERIQFSHITFGYDEARPVLHDVSFHLRPGTITALVGPTGSGKSTIGALLLRLFDPQHGTITVDGVALPQLELATVRQHVGVVLQEAILFQTTIRENIRFGAPDASDDAIREAARVACADRFIAALPDGYDTMLGERGSKLSTGERQRINVARALLKAPSVLILDEPTAALDAATELDLLRNLAVWARERAVLIITHRLSTIRRADQIVMLREGRVVEAGTHETLVAHGQSSYRHLVEREERAASWSAGDA